MSDTRELEICTEPLGGSPLAQRLIRGEAPDSWAHAAPRTPEGWQTRLDVLRHQFAAGASIELLAPAFSAHGAAAERLARVSSGAGVVVTTGQQPGLFGGPMYTLHKALTALALADEIERETGVPVAPVFWAATDDTDFLEASGVAIADGGRVEHLAGDALAPEGTPMAEAPLGDVSAQLDRLAQASGSAAFAPALDAVRKAYAEGETVGSAYVKLLRDLLAPLGIAVLDASHPTVRAAGFQLMRRALLKSADIAAAVDARDAELRAAGHEPQVLPVEGLSLVFRTEGGAKRRVALAEARSLVTQVKPGELSPNVLLRPVVERSILPTAAYVAGPGELAYFAQATAVAEALGVPVPLAVPRWSGTIVEPTVKRALERLGLEREELRDPHAAEARLARAAMPGPVAQSLAALRAAASAQGEQLAAATRANGELLPERTLAGMQASLTHRVDRIERRFVAAVKRREESVMRDVALARVTLYPDGSRQERVLSFIPPLARYGDALIESLRDATRAHARALTGHSAAGVRQAPERDVVSPR